MQKLRDARPRTTTAGAAVARLDLPCSSMAGSEVLGEPNTLRRSHRVRGDGDLDLLDTSKIRKEKFP